MPRLRGDGPEALGRHVQDEQALWPVHGVSLPSEAEKEVGVMSKMEMKGSLRPLPTPPPRKKRTITPEKREERLEAFAYFMMRGFDESFFVKMGRDQYGVGPKTVRRICEQVQDRWARDDQKSLHGAERNRDILYLNEMLRKLTHYPAGTQRERGGKLEDVGGQEISDPKEIPFQTVLAVVRERASLWRRRGEGKLPKRSVLLGAAALVEVEGEDEGEEAVHGD